MHVLHAAMHRALYGFVDYWFKEINFICVVFVFVFVFVFMCVSICIQ